MPFQLVVAGVVAAETASPFSPGSPTAFIALIKTASRAGVHFNLKLDGQTPSPDAATPCCANAPRGRFASGSRLAGKESLAVIGPFVAAATAALFCPQHAKRCRAFQSARWHFHPQ